MLTFKIKDAFFDRPAVKKSMDKARHAVLSKAAMHTRKVAINILRRRKKASTPGTPPSVHAPSGSFPSLKYILAGFDPPTDGFVVGPTKANQVNETETRMRTTVPGLHERGGTVSILESRFVPDRGKPTAWRRKDRRRRSRIVDWGKSEFRRRTARYPARPFMRPALERATPKIRDLFKDSIRPVSVRVSS